MRCARLQSGTRRHTEDPLEFFVAFYYAANDARVRRFEQLQHFAQVCLACDEEIVVGNQHVLRGGQHGRDLTPISDARAQLGVSDESAVVGQESLPSFEMLRRMFGPEVLNDFVSYHDSHPGVVNVETFAKISQRAVTILRFQVYGNTVNGIMASVFRDGMHFDWESVFVQCTGFAHAVGSVCS